MADFPLPPPSIQLRLYADDIQFSITKDIQSEAQAELQRYANQVAAWTRTWHLRLSILKCAAMLFSRRKRVANPLVLKIGDDIIPTVSSFKFLGVIFDSRLYWYAHLRELESKIRRTGGLLKSLTTRRAGLGFRSLLRIFSALIRSQIDYGAVVLSSLPKHRTRNLDVIQNGLLRALVGGFKSTPTALLHIETGILPLSDRWQQLTAIYLFRLDSKPWNPTYESIWRATHSNIVWKQQSTPYIIPAIHSHRLLDQHIFCKDYLDYPVVSPFPPWSRLEFDINYFPMTKKEACVNPIVTAAKFLECLTSVENPNITHLPVHTDASCVEDPFSAACAIFAPKVNLSLSWALSNLKNNFTAELYGILMALRSVYQFDYDKITIFTDSKSAVDALSNRNCESSPVILQILNEIENHSAAGTRVCFTWIPSHCGIPGNEFVDTLANQGRTAPSNGHLHNAISTEEKIAAHRRNLSTSIIAKLKSDQFNCAVLARSSLGPFPWLLHPSRRIQTALIHLRSGHNRLNYHMSKIDINISPNCPHDCEADETPDHVLTECPEYEPFRGPLRRFFLHNTGHEEDFVFDSISILGLNKNIPTALQHKIQQLLICFLNESDLIHRV